MKIVLACYGSRGDVEPCVTVGRELLHRGHDVRMVVPPDLVGFAESAGLSAVGCGVELQDILDAHRNFWAGLFRKPWQIRELIRSRREVGKPIMRCWEQMSATLISLSDGADLLFSGLNFEDAAANVAEYHDIPLATLHYFPLRVNGELLPFLPAPVGRFVMRLFWWVSWRGTKKVEDTQRRELGLPKATGPSRRRITDRGSLEIQAYDEVCFPGLAAEWAKYGGQRPFVGALTLESPTEADGEVASWIAGGTPPIFFGFGSIRVESAADTLAMISAACEQLGERALVCAAGTDFGSVPQPEHVKVVATVNYAATLPACRAVVHHGGAGTTAAGLRAGVPTLILSTDLDQTLWGTRVKRLKVGTARRFSATTRESLVADLRIILAPQYAARARENATQMTIPAESVCRAADLVEHFARLRRIG
ncbi:glycosyltransferase [Mycobacterium sp. 94-17]|uniref:glycosyltransferase n=1 Tax=Mycobacterium sp. 94-17 TaxID=2986147 RepID=UPI002D1F115E|nr:glycosyltransferase [Mycobacterium sp. 94-17]MEB4212261.1 glycosyltransferase [Mycobacterium sp. 94-17]